MVDTKLTRSPIEAAAILKAGGLVAFPTETVYGLGADAFNETAIAKIFEAKNRPADNPLIAHISSIEQIGLLAAETNDQARRLIDEFFPGPLTVVLKKLDSVPDIATAGLNSIGIRMPRNEFAREFLAACGTPVVAPSANLSGRPSPTTWQAVNEDLHGRIDCILQGEATETGLESTVVDCRSGAPYLLRLGSVSFEAIRDVVPQISLAGPGVSGETRSPGLKHKHYAPRAAVKIWTGHCDDVDRAAFIGTSEPKQRFALMKIVPSPEAYARELFEFFRECDRRGIEVIYCEPVDEIGIGAALMDRIGRASKAGT